MNSSSSHRPTDRHGNSVRSESATDQESAFDAGERLSSATLHDRVGNECLAGSLGGDATGIALVAAGELAQAVSGLSPSPSAFDSNVAMQQAMRSADGVDWQNPALANLGKQGGGVPLPEAQRQRFEAAFGRDLSGVRIHTDYMASEASHALAAHAFTLGESIWFGPGQYAPGTPRGDELLAHELTHVQQHEEGRLPIRSGGGGVSNPTDPAEQEAYANEDKIVASLTAPSVDGPMDDRAILDLVARSRGSALPAAVASRMSAALGRNMAGVMVHTDAIAADAADQVDARAFALGSHLFFGAGQFKPGSGAGDALIAHELSHVVQFADGGLGAGGLEMSTPGDSTERQADAMAADVMETSPSMDADIAPLGIGSGPAPDAGVMARAGKGSDPAAPKAKKLEFAEHAGQFRGEARARASARPAAPAAASSSASSASSSSGGASSSSSGASSSSSSGGGGSSSSSSGGSSSSSASGPLSPGGSGSSPPAAAAPKGPMASTPLGAKYKGEEKGAQSATKAELGDVLGKNTTYYPKSEKAAQEEYGVNAVGGQLRRGVGGEGGVVNTADRKDKDGKVTPGTKALFDKDEEERETFAMNSFGELMMADPREEALKHKERINHSSMLAGADAAAAGTLKVRDGKVESLGDGSGHYKPKVAQTYQATSKLVEMGVMDEDLSTVELTPTNNRKKFPTDRDGNQGKVARVAPNLLRTRELLAYKKEMEAALEKARGEQDEDARAKILAEPLKQIQDLHDIAREVGEKAAKYGQFRKLWKDRLAKDAKAREAKRKGGGGEGKDQPAASAAGGSAPGDAPMSVESAAQPVVLSPAFANMQAAEHPKAADHAQAADSHGDHPKHDHPKDDHAKGDHPKGEEAPASHSEDAAAGQGGGDLDDHYAASRELYQARGLEGAGSEASVGEAAAEGASGGASDVLPPDANKSDEAVAMDADFKKEVEEVIDAAIEEAQKPEAAGDAPADAVDVGSENGAYQVHDDLGDGPS